MRPLLSITFPQGFQISKKFEHPTSGSGGKKTLKRYLKSEHTDKHTDKQTHGRTFWLIESIGPEGRCCENMLEYDTLVWRICVLSLSKKKKLDLIKLGSNHPFYLDKSTFEHIIFWKGLHVCYDNVNFWI